MAEWRDILNRAADNLSVDLNHRSQPSFRQQPAGWPAQRPGLGQAPFVASRDRLARELEGGLRPGAIPAAPSSAASSAAGARAEGAGHGSPGVSYAGHRPAGPGRAAQVEVQAPPAAKKSGSGRELAALSISVGIVAFAVYGFFVLLH